MTTRKKSPTPTNPVVHDVDNPGIRFLLVRVIDGMDYGACPSCNQIGDIGKMCIQCNEEKGMVIGVCPFCKDQGRLGEVCEECKAEQYEEKVTTMKTTPTKPVVHDVDNLGIRFLLVRVKGGTNYGACPSCNQIGDIGKLCIPCNEEEGMVVGVCPFCSDHGRMGDVCEECESELYVEELGYGKCGNCGKEGMLGTVCDDCEDQGMIFE